MIEFSEHNLSKASSVNPVILFSLPEDKIMTELKDISKKGKNLVQYGDSDFYSIPSYNRSSKYKAVVNFENNEAVEFCDNKIFAHYNFITKKPFVESGSFPPELIKSIGCSLDSFHKPNDFLNFEISKFYGLLSDESSDDDDQNYVIPNDGNIINENSTEDGAITELKTKEEELTALEKQLYDKEKDLEERSTFIQTKEEEITLQEERLKQILEENIQTGSNSLLEKSKILESKEKELVAREESIQSKEIALAEREKELDLMQETLRNKTEQIDSREKEIIVKEEAINEKGEEVERLKEELQKQIDNIDIRNKLLISKEDQNKQKNLELIEREKFVTARENEIRDKEQQVYNKELEIQQREYAIKLKESSPQSVQNTVETSLELPSPPKDKLPDSTGSPIRYRIPTKSEYATTFSDYTHRKKNDKIFSDLVNSKSIISQQNGTINKLLCEKNDLSSQIQEANEKIAEYEQNLKNTRFHYKLLESSNAAYKEQVDYLQKQIQQLSQPKQITKYDVLKYFETSKPDTANEIGWYLLGEMFKNFHNKPNGRSYSDDSKEMYWALNAQGNTVYKTLHYIFPTPSYNTLNKMMQPQIVNIESSMLDISKIREEICSYAKRFNLNGKIKATLAVDAICVEPISISSFKQQLAERSSHLLPAYMTQIEFNKGIIKKEIADLEQKLSKTSNPSKIKKLEDKISEFNMKIDTSNINQTILNDVFIFYLEPLDPKYPCLPVHIYLQQSGAANKVIRELIEQVIIQLEADGFIDIIDLSTDGDPGHQLFYKKANLLLLMISRDLNINILSTSDQLDKYHMASADFLHFIKTLRIKYLMSKISIIPTDNEAVFSMQDVLPSFEKSSAYTDLSHIGKMRDVYPLQLFSLHNINKLIEMKNYKGVVSFLPWVLWNTAITNKLFTPDARLQMLKITFEFLRRFYNVIHIPKNTWQSNVNMVCKEDCLCTICTKAGLERLIPTLAVYISQLNDYIQKKAQDPKIDIDLAFDRLGSHPLENFNGLIRMCARNNDSINSTSHIIGRSFLVKMIFNKYGIPTNIRGRVNTGGVRLSECLNMTNMPDDIKPDVLVDSLMILSGLASNQTILVQQTPDEKAIEDFFSFLKEAEELSIKHKTFLKLNVPLYIRNFSIDNRMAGYNKNSKKKNQKYDPMYI